MPGSLAGWLIGQAALAMEFVNSIENQQLSVKVHPALNEVTHEAPLAVARRKNQSTERCGRRAR